MDSGRPKAGLCRCSPTPLGDHRREDGARGGVGPSVRVAVNFFFLDMRSRACSQPPRRWTGRRVRGEAAVGDPRHFQNPNRKGGSPTLSRGPGVASLRRIVAHCWEEWGHFDRPEEGEGWRSLQRMHHAPRTGSVDRDPIWPTEQTADQRSRKRSFARAGGVVLFLLFASSIFLLGGKEGRRKFCRLMKRWGFCIGRRRTAGRHHNLPGSRFSFAVCSSPFAVM